MGDFSQTLIARSGYDGRGFAGVYDEARPAPPESVLDVLTHVARMPRPRLVVDLGCGTGLSTRAWAKRAAEAVGVEANPTMVAQARAAATAPGVRYVEASADETLLPGGEADLVTCAQAFHWMEPAPVLGEAARLLRPGGVFAAYDYDWPPAIEPEIDAAFATHQAARGEARRRLRLEAGAATWPKEKHAEQIRATGIFSGVRELLCHGWEDVDAARVRGLAESIGGPRAIFGDQEPAVAETFDRLIETACRVLGDGRARMLLCYRLRVGLRS